MARNFKYFNELKKGEFFFLNDKNLYIKIDDNYALPALPYEDEKIFEVGAMVRTY